MTKAKQISTQGHWTALVSDDGLKMRHGRAVVNAKDRQLTFMEDEPRKVHSKELSKTEHGRMRERDDGLYFISFRFEFKERYIKECLLSELRRMIRDEEERKKRLEKQK